MSDDLDFVAPVALPFADGELALAVGPMNMAQLFKALREVRPLVDEIMLLPPDTFERLVAARPDDADITYLLALVCDRAELAARLVSIATGLPPERVEALLPDRFAYLLSLVVEANADFFVRSAAVFRAAGQRLQRLQGTAAPAPSASAGPTPSTS